MKKEEIKEVLSNWDIGKVKSIKLSKKGVVNYNWFIKTDKGEFFLRKFMGNHSLEDLKFEIDYLKKLKTRGFNYKTPSPIVSKEGNFLIKYKNRYFWLDNFIEGKIKTRFGKEELTELARMLSQYHNILEKLKIRCKRTDNKDFGRKIVLNEMNLFLKKINKKNKLSKEEKIYLKECNKLIPLLKILDTKDYSELKKYAIHRDLNPENILWKNNKISGILDFENVSQENDSFIKDICIILQSPCSDKKHNLNMDKARFFINEYKSHRNLTKKEICLIPDLMSAGFIEDYQYQFWLWVNDKKRANINNLKLYSKRAQDYYNNKNNITKEMMKKDYTKRLGEFTEKLRNIPEIIAVYYTGSTAKKSWDEFSDIDVDIIVEDKDYNKIVKKLPKVLSMWGKIKLCNHYENHDETYAFIGENYEKIEIDPIKKSDLKPSWHLKNIRIAFDKEGTLTKAFKKSQKEEKEKLNYNYFIWLFKELRGNFLYASRHFARGQKLSGASEIGSIGGQLFINLGKIKGMEDYENIRSAEKHLTKKEWDFLKYSSCKSLNKADFEKSLKSNWKFMKYLEEMYEKTSGKKLNLNCDDKEILNNIKMTLNRVK